MILNLKALRVNNIFDFDFLSPPTQYQFEESLTILYSLQAIDAQGNLTMPIGEQLSQLTIDPKLGVALLKSNEFKVCEEVLSICSIFHVIEHLGGLFYSDIKEDRLAEA